ncbi:MAG: pyruvate ferredoxin oxidoreductase [Sulfolobales archaeon]
MSLRAPAPPRVVEVPKKRPMTGARAIAEAVKLADVDVIVAYPIRPYTGIMNALAEMLAHGEFTAEFIIADSEHSQFEIVKHASAVGARVFVGSSGVGLIYATEAIVVTPMNQLPVVGIVGCRALDDPGNFGMEWNDALLFRDVGWLISWAKDPQEALDMTLVAYRVAEDRRVLLPHFIAIDGATITHIAAPVEVPTKKSVEDFLPPYKPLYPLDPAAGPITKAQHIAPSLIGPELRKLVDVSMKRAREVIIEAWKDYATYVGRDYPPFVETYFMDDAKIALVTMGAYTINAVYAAEQARREGIKVGVVRLRYVRPFPSWDLKKVLSTVEGFGVLEFSFSIGSPDYGGVLFNEVRAAMYENPKPALDFLFLGGREPKVEHFMKAIKLVDEYVRTGKTPGDKRVFWLTLRGEDI